MNSTMQVYYGADFLPYKDSSRQVHYPIVSKVGGGSLIVGENNTTTIRFYTTLIGGNSNYWVVDVKLPNGQVVYKLLGQGLQDNETGEWYVDLSISDLYTTIRGEIFVSLKGYSGEISFEEEDDNYFLNGNPTILATGVVKIMVNYAPQVLYRGGEFEHSELEQIIADLSNKLDITKGIVVVNDLTFVSSSEYANYENDQLFYAVSIGELFKKIATSPYYSLVEANYVKKKTDAYKLYGTGAGGSQTTIGYGVAGSTGTIVQRDVNGNLRVPLTPSSNEMATSKSYVDTELAKKVDKSSSTEIVYGTDDTGNQTTYAIDSDLVGNGEIVRRESGSGTVVVGTPTAVNHATTKSYVDTEVQGAKNYAKDYADTLFTSALVYKGTLSVAQISALDISTIKVGDFYNVSNSGTITWTYSGTTYTLDVLKGDNIAWTGSSWDKLTMDLSEYDDKFIAAGFFEVQDYDEDAGTITLVYASDLYTMTYDTDSGVLTIQAS